MGRKIEALAARDAPDFRSLTAWMEVISLLLEPPVIPLNAAVETSRAWPDAKLQQLLDWIEKRSAEALKQSEVAMQARMSPSAFSRWFKRHMGCVFQRHLHELRIARACALLIKGDGSITDAAFQAGFNNLSNFNRRFHEITGWTPKDSRKQFRRRRDGVG